MKKKCRECNRSFNPKEEYHEWCYDCYNGVFRNVTPEKEVVEAVIACFSKPKFQRFLTIEEEYKIQIGCINSKADLVLANGDKNIVAVIECKRVGHEGRGRDQLESYLSATDTQFGVFANSAEPEEWNFCENRRRHNFQWDITRSCFETEILAGRTIESIREEKNKLIREIERRNEQQGIIETQINGLRIKENELDAEIGKKNKQLAQLKKEINPLRTESAELKKEIRQNAQQAKVLEGLKLKSTREGLTEEISLLMKEKDQLESEVGTKKEQCTQLAKKNERLGRSQDVLEKQIRSESKKLKQVKQQYRQEIGEQEPIHQRIQGLKSRRNYLEKINADLKGRIESQNYLIRDLGRLSRLDELEAESIYGQLQEEVKRLDEQEKYLAEATQQRMQKEGEKQATLREINRLKGKKSELETKFNQNIQQRAHEVKEKQVIFERLRAEVYRLISATSEQNAQIEQSHKLLVQDILQHRSAINQLSRKINELETEKSELEVKLGSLATEEGKIESTLKQVSEKINLLGIKKHQLEGELGQKTFTILWLAIQSR